MNTTETSSPRISTILLLYHSLSSLHCATQLSPTLQHLVLFSSGDFSSKSNETRFIDLGLSCSALVSCSGGGSGDSGDCDRRLPVGDPASLRFSKVVKSAFP